MLIPSVVAQMEIRASQIWNRGGRGGTGNKPPSHTWKDGKGQLFLQWIIQISTCRGSQFLRKGDLHRKDTFQTRLRSSFCLGTEVRDVICLRKIHLCHKWQQESPKFWYLQYIYIYLKKISTWNKRDGVRPAVIGDSLLHQSSESCFLWIILIINLHHVLCSCLPLRHLSC